jgi:hypothetical protein
MNWENGPTKMAEQCMFRLFHEDKERREVADASRVGFTEFDATFPNK